MSFLTLISGVIPIILKADEIALGIAVNAVNLVNFIALFVIIGIVDGKVKRRFDKDGNRKGGDCNE